MQLFHIVIYILIFSTSDSRNPDVLLLSKVREIGHLHWKSASFIENHWKSASLSSPNQITEKRVREADFQWKRSIFNEIWQPLSHLGLSCTSASLTNSCDLSKPIRLLKRGSERPREAKRGQFSMKEADVQWNLAASLTPRPLSHLGLSR